MAPSFNPKTGLYYFNVREGCDTFYSKSPVFKEGTSYWATSARAEADEHQKGRVTAINPLTGETKWSVPFKEPRHVDQIGGILTTAGNLLFVGDRSDFLALDARNGNELWRINLGGNINANPISYAVGGEQMVAIAAGNSLFVFKL